MKATKAGIWMDHSHAYLIEFTEEPIATKKIESPLKKSKMPNLRFGEKRLNATEQREQSFYYKELTKLIRKYKEVILFGPTTAEKELFNLLHENHVLQLVDVRTARTGKLTARQMNAFVKKHFTKATMPA